MFPLWNDISKNHSVKNTIWYTIRNKFLILATEVNSVGVGIFALRQLKKKNYLFGSFTRKKSPVSKQGSSRFNFPAAIIP